MASDVFGWGGVVWPHERIHKGIPIRTNHRIYADNIDNTVAMAMRSGAKDRMGVLTAVVAEMVLMGHESPMLGGGALLVSEEFGGRFWWIEAKKDPVMKGTYTSIYALDASTPEEAEKAFMSLPSVRMMDITNSFIDAIEQLKKKR